MWPEEIEDFTWEENKEFADIICNSLKTRDIERLEAIAEAGGVF